MNRRLLMVCILALTTGCAAHYYQVQGDMLALYLDRPEAQEVIFACSLDGFEPHEARKEDGRWVVSVPCQFQFRYYYVMDGELFLPPCELKENDDFGSENCIFNPNL